jgi:hypothetical protein
VRRMQSGLVGGEGLSITFKLGLKRSIQHIRFSRTTVIKMARSHGTRRFEDRDRRRLSKKIRFLAPPNYIIHDCAERVLSTIGGIWMPSAAGDCVAQGARARVIAFRF